jgi:ATP-dependent protease ClpP protease subunit
MQGREAEGQLNKRRRDILTALTPAIEFAMRNCGECRDAQAALAKPGLAFTPRAEAGTPAELMIYGRIGGGGWFADGISAADVAAVLREAGPGPINVRINSGGGDVFDGVAIHSLLARHAGTVTAYVDGLAASAASFIMLAADRIVAARNSFIMIHDAMTYTYGNGDTHRAAGELLDKVSDNIADMYSERAGEDPAYWRGKMTENGEDGVWYTGQEALDAGLVDEITVAAKGEDDAEGELEDAHVARLLAGWQDILPASIAASLTFPPDLVEDSSSDVGTADGQTQQDDRTVTAFRDLMKGVLA